MKKVVIIGASGLGKISGDAVLCAGDEILGYLDDNPELGDTFFNCPVLGKSADYEKYRDCYFLVSIGNSAIRERIVNSMTGVKWYTAIHPKAVISPYGVTIGEGSVVLPGAVIDPDAAIGRHCLINCNALVAHDSVLGDFCHVSAGTMVAGTVHVGAHTWVGIGATVSNNLDICDHVMIGAGAVVVKPITEPGTYVGVPAKKLEKKA